MRTIGLFCLVALLAFPGCASVKLQPVDFSWALESILTTDANGMARGEPKTLTFNAGQLFLAETNQAGAPAGAVINVIRNVDGYYFVTAPGFRNVYIFTSGVGNLVLEKKVLIDERGMGNPYFNRRNQGIELGANDQVYLLNEQGIISRGTK